MEKPVNLLFNDTETVSPEERWKMGSNLRILLKNGFTAFFTNVTDVQIQGPLMIVKTTDGENSMIPMNVVAFATNHKGKEPKDLEWESFGFDEEDEDEDESE